MRSLLLVGVLAGLVSPGNAADKMTVTQLEQIVAQHAMQSTGEKPKKQTAHAPDEIAIDLSDGDLLHQLDQDDELIPQIQGTELTNRLSTLTLYRLIGKYNLGPHVQQALEQLADRSALLPLPPDEQLRLPSPDAAAQVKMLAASRSYVLRELSHLPNFVATETTTRFDNSPTTLKYFQTLTDRAGFHRVGTVERKITFQDGKEVVDTANGAPQANRKDGGLESRGEFGTEAAEVLMDLEKGLRSLTTGNKAWEAQRLCTAILFRGSRPITKWLTSVWNGCLFTRLPGTMANLRLIQGRGRFCA